MLLRDSVKSSNALPISLDPFEIAVGTSLIAFSKGACNNSTCVVLLEECC